MGGKGRGRQCTRRARLGPRLEVNCVAHGIVHHVVLHAQARHLRQHNAAIVALVQRVASYERRTQPIRLKWIGYRPRRNALDPRGERLVSERVQEELRAKLRRAPSLFLLFSENSVEIVNFLALSRV